MPGIRAALAAAALLCCLPTGAGAAEIEGVEFAERVEVDGRALPLHGVGLLRYRWVFKGYVAALYLPADVAGDDVLADVPKRLELEYFWSIEGPKFGEAAVTLLERNLDATALRPLRERVERLHRAYRDVAPGDRYALDYAPGRGTTLAKNGEPLVTIEGADFQAAYFSIWLGKSPLDADLKRQLLDGR